MRNAFRSSWLPSITTLFAIASLAAPWNSFAGGTVATSSETELRNAVASGGLVTIAFSGTTVLTSPLVLSSDTTIDASGYNFTLSGGGTTRILEIPEGQTLRIRGFALSQGRVSGQTAGIAVKGGAILVEGSLHASSCIFSENSAIGAAGLPEDVQSDATDGSTASGAAISSSGSMFLTNCVFLRNVTTGGTGGPSVSIPKNGLKQSGNGGASIGGALSIESGISVIQDATFKENSAQGGLPGFAEDTGTASPGTWGRTGSGKGGSIAVAGGYLTVLGSRFETNLASSPDNPGSKYYKGGAEAQGGGIFQGAGSLLLSNSIFSGNIAIGGSSVGRGSVGSRGTAGPAQGGALASYGSAQIYKTKFLNNTATGGSAGLPTLGNGDGGALFMAGQCLVSSSVFYGNSAIPGSGVWDGFTANSYAALPRGGAIHNTGVLAIESTTFHANQALAAAAIGLARAFPAYGGAVFNSGTIGITNSTLSENTSNGGNWKWFEQAPYEFHAGGDGWGGALYNTVGIFILENCTMKSNNALPGTGVPNGSANGGSVSIQSGSGILRNSIFVNGSTGMNIYVDSLSGGQLTDGGHNIVADGSSGFTSGTSLVNTDPKLGTLSDNGGPTLTIPLLPDSPAINAISSGYPSTDQRGFARPNGVGADTGAFEFDGVPAVITLASINGSITGWGLIDEFSLSLVGGSSTTTINRAYGFSGLSAGSYTVVPSHPDYFFLPPSRFITVTSQSTNVAFQAFRYGKMSLDTSSTGAISVAFPSTSGGSFVLLRSSNLTSWLPIQTNFIVGPGGLSQWLIPTTNSGPAFFKVVKP